MHDVPLWHLYLLRAAYAFVLVGLALTQWPSVPGHDLKTPLADGLVNSLLSGVGVLAAIGLRYPLKMLPLMFFEIAWKSIWLLAYALPLSRAGQVDADTHQTIFACSMAIIFPIVIPWGYVWRHYLREPSDRWWKARS